MYNFGIGMLLHKQSNDKILTKYFEPIPGNHPINSLFKKVLESLMEDDYDYDVVFIIIT